MARKTRQKGKRGERHGRTVGDEGLVKVNAGELTPDQRRAVEEIADSLGKWLDDIETGGREVATRVLREIFDDDAEAMASADRLRNPRLAYLLERVRRDRRVSLRSFTVMLRVAAYDELVKGPYWKRLDAKVKPRLLPLVDPKKPTDSGSLGALAAAAKHALAFDLNTSTADAFVQNKLLEGGRERRRNARRRTFEQQLDRSLYLFGEATGVDRLLTVSAGMGAREVAAFEAKLERVAKALLIAASKLKAHAGE